MQPVKIVAIVFSKAKQLVVPCIELEAVVVVMLCNVKGKANLIALAWNSFPHIVLVLVLWAQKANLNPIQMKN